MSIMVANEPTSWTAIIEYCAVTNMFIAYIPGLCGAHAQATNAEDVRCDIQQVIDLLYTNNALIKNADIRGSINITLTQNLTQNAVRMPNE